MNSLLFTAAEIARCLNCTPQNVRKGLCTIPADGKRRVCGVPAAAWSFSSLPSPVIEKLARLAIKLGFETPLQLLREPPKRNQLPNLSRVADSEIERAQKLQRSFAASFALPVETSVSELARVAAPHYARELGREVSDRYLSKLINRVLTADGGARNFARLEIYMPARPARKSVRSSPLSGRFEFKELDAHFVAITNIANPSVRDVAFAWRKVVAFFCDRVTAGANAAALKKELRSHLLSVASFLSDSPEAMKRNLNRKLRDATENGIESLVDGRIEPGKSKAAKRLTGEFDNDLKLLARHARFYCAGRISQAFRQLHEGTSHNGDRFSELFRERFSFDCRLSKSRVPGIVRRAVAPMVEATAPLRLGPRAAKLSLPSIQRDWSEVAPGDSYTSDDVTLNHYVYDWNEAGECEFDGRRFNFMRPQFLPVADERTDLPLGFSLIPRRNYTSWEIKTLMTRVCMRREIGLPFKQFLFEKGIWDSRNVNALALDEWTRLDESFARSGIKLAVRHATTPKAKVIERVIGQLQNLDEYHPGYIGRGEREEKFERVHDFLRALKRVGQPLKADVHPGEMLMSLDEYAEQIEAVMRRFADEPQNGERLPGISPAEGWRQSSKRRVHRVLPESLRFLLGTVESLRTVTTEGIELRIGRMKHKYCGSEKLGALIGEKVRVRYNPELPEMISVAHVATDPNALHPFSVPLFERVPAHGATAEQFDRAREHQNAFANYGRTLYRELAPKDNLTRCDSLIGSDQLRASGQAHNQLEREHVDLIADRESNRGAISRLAARQNLAIDSRRVKRPDRVRQHLESAERRRSRILESERQLAAKEQST